MRGTKKIDWLNHGLEFVMVVVGILIAFQLNTCSEEKKNDVIVNQHISNVLSESAFNLKMIDDIIVQTEDSQKNLSKLLQLIAQEKSWDTINNLTLRQLNYSGVYLKDNAYNSLIQSGDIRLVNDFELKNDIINLYEYYKWTQSFDLINGEVFAGYFLPYVMNEFDMFQLQTQDASIYTDQRFKNALGSMSYQMNARLAKYKETKTIIETFLRAHQKQTDDNL
ncbi:MAG: DUF6090 family protein [Gilvibacter sp.]